MMSVGLGIDTVEIQRISRAMRNNKFLKFILGDKEYIFFEKRGFNIQSISANFCCKEAFTKSINTGFRNMCFRDIQILRDDVGKPYFIFSGNALKTVEKNRYKFLLSMTHTKNYATAVVMCFKEDF